MMEVLEGKQCVLPALKARQRKFQVLLVKQGALLSHVSDVVAAAEEQSIPIKVVPPNEIDALTQGRSHGGIAAICTPKLPLTAVQLAELCKALREPAFLVLIEGTEDAQNLGYTMRSAEALGTHAVLLKKHVWNFESAAVSRASSGAFERLPLAQIENAEKELSPLAAIGIQFWGAIAGAKRIMYEVDFTGPVLLVIGGERRGISGAMRQLCHGFLRIPTIHGATSLSMSHAATILMAEVRRQRFQRAQKA